MSPGEGREGALVVAKRPFPLLLLLCPAERVLRSAAAAAGATR